MATRVRKAKAPGLTFDQAQIDFLMLADRVEVINGKLYVMGGAWTVYRWPDFNQPIQFGIAAGVLVPWNATNQEHHLSIAIEDENGTNVPPPATVRLNVGRPPDAVRGQSFLTPIALNGLWKLPGEGMYRVVAVLGEEQRKDTSFRTIKIPPQVPAARA